MMDRVEVGRWYRLQFPGTFAKVICFDDRNTYPYLVQSLVTRARWWVDGLGRPNNYKTPRLRLRRV